MTTKTGVHIIFQCFYDDILFNDTTGKIKTLISQIAIANRKEMTGEDVSSNCPSYKNGMCNIGNQKCSLKPEWYPVCSFHRSEFLDLEGGHTFLKGH